MALPAAGSARLRRRYGRPPAHLGRGARCGDHRTGGRLRVVVPGAGLGPTRLLLLVRRQAAVPAGLLGGELGRRRVVDRRGGGQAGAGHPLLLRRQRHGVGRRDAGPRCGLVGRRLVGPLGLPAVAGPARGGRVRLRAAPHLVRRPRLDVRRRRRSCRPTVAGSPGGGTHGSARRRRVPGRRRGRAGWRCSAPRGPLPFRPGRRAAPVGEHPRAAARRRTSRRRGCGSSCRVCRGSSRGRGLSGLLRGPSTGAGGIVLGGPVRGGWARQVRVAGGLTRAAPRAAALAGCPRRWTTARRSTRAGRRGRAGGGPTAVAVRVVLLLAAAGGGRRRRIAESVARQSARAGRPAHRRPSRRPGRPGRARAGVGGRGCGTRAAPRAGSGCAQPALGGGVRARSGGAARRRVRLRGGGGPAGPACSCAARPRRLRRRAAPRSPTGRTGPGRVCSAPGQPTRGPAAAHPGRPRRGGFGRSDGGGGAQPRSGAPAP